ncbi:putative type VI secretion system effector [Orbus sturtevantii]|uniref:putative type VI secretion system effector n=1 Tax=Orbus sturtevantii TaxID=3074109 RepID=UPI00370D682B
MLDKNTIPYATFNNKDTAYTSKEDLLKKTGISIPDPILPPKKLVRLTGTLSEFKAIFCRAPLMGNAYMTDEQKQQQKAKLRTGAAAAMLNGNSTAALAALGRADGKDDSNYLPALYISGKLNGTISLKGWLGCFQFNDGDQVEVVAEQHADHYEVYAMLKPAEQIICIIPPCSGGRNKLLKNFITSFFIFYVLFSLFMIYVFFSFNLEDILIVFFTLGGFLGILSILTYGSFRTTYVELAEQIFATLGWKNVQYINLKAMTKDHIDELIVQGKYSLDWDNAKDIGRRPAKSASRRAIGLFYYQPEVVFKKTSNQAKLKQKTRR